MLGRPEKRRPPGGRLNHVANLIMPSIGRLFAEVPVADLRRFARNAKPENRKLFLFFAAFGLLLGLRFFQGLARFFGTLGAGFGALGTLFFLELFAAE